MQNPREQGWGFCSEVGLGSAPSGENKLGAEVAACFDSVRFHLFFKPSIREGELLLIGSKEHDAACESLTVWFREAGPGPGQGLLDATSFHGMHRFHGQTTLQPSGRCSSGSISPGLAKLVRSLAFLHHRRYNPPASASSPASGLMSSAARAAAWVERCRPHGRSGDLSGTANIWPWCLRRARAWRKTERK